jgi:hypothetical protein
MVCNAAADTKTKLESVMVLIIGGVVAVLCVLIYTQLADNKT